MGSKNNPITSLQHHQWCHDDRCRTSWHFSLSSLNSFFSVDDLPQSKLVSSFLHFPEIFPPHLFLLAFSTSSRRMTNRKFDNTFPISKTTTAVIQTVSIKMEWNLPKKIKNNKMRFSLTRSFRWWLGEAFSFVTQFLSRFHLPQMRHCQCWWKIDERI